MYSLQQELDRLREEQIDYSIAKNNQAMGEDITENPLYNEVYVYWDYLSNYCSSIKTVEFMMTEKVQNRFI
jgi:hypothetical protein